MKTVYLERFGVPDVLQFCELTDPVAGPGEIMGVGAAASLTAADWRSRAGSYARHAATKFPLIPGRDFSGTVSALGSGVEDLKIGDAIFGVLDIGREGTYAEKLAIKA